MLAKNSITKTGCPSGRSQVLAALLLFLDLPAFAFQYLGGSKKSSGSYQCLDTRISKFIAHGNKRLEVVVVGKLAPTQQTHEILCFNESCQISYLNQKWWITSLLSEDTHCFVGLFGSVEVCPISVRSRVHL